MSAYARLDALKRELRFDHWEHVYNWIGIDEQMIQAIAKRHACTPQQVKDAMKAIEKQYPKPNRSRTAKAAEKMVNSSTCKYCGEVIVWIGNTPCNPTIFKGVTVEEKVVLVRELHTETCRKKT